MSIIHSVFVLSSKFVLLRTLFTEISYFSGQKHFKHLRIIVIYYVDNTEKLDVDKKYTIIVCDEGYNLFLCVGVLWNRIFPIL